MKTILAIVAALSLGAAVLAAFLGANPLAGVPFLTSAIVAGSVVAILDRLDKIHAALAQTNSIKKTASTAMPPVLS